MSVRVPATLSLQDYFNPSSQKQFSQQLMDSLAEFGFVVVRNHGIDLSTFTQAYEYSSALFSLPRTSKDRYELGHGQRGYIGFGKERAAGETVGDLKEYWHIGPESIGIIDGENYPANIWPEEIPGFQAFFCQLQQQLHSVAGTVCQALAQALAIDKDFFKEKIEGGNSVQRLIHYPPLRGLKTEGAVRAAAHADINLMTLLIGATDSGLELLDKQGNWLAVEHEPDAIVIDTGDMMARITNNFLPATVHRVVNPSSNDRARYSIPYFVHPRNSVVLEPLSQFKGEEPGASPVTAGEFLAERLRQNGF